jgi:hypothetical protein
LLGRETPELRVTFASMPMVSAARHAAQIVAYAMTLWFVRRRGRLRWIVLAAAISLLLLLAHFTPGVHRRIVWGVDLALLFTLFRIHGRRLWRLARVALRAPWRAIPAVSVRRLIAMTGFAWLAGALAARPMLLSMTALGVMALLVHRAVRVVKVESVRNVEGSSHAS